MIAMRLLSFSTLLALLLQLPVAVADSWRFDPVENNRTEIYGKTKIVLTTDARRDVLYPDFIVSIYFKNELLAKYRSIGFQKLFASPDQSRFVGLSNDGLPGTAVVVFDNKGNLLLEAKHGIATFDYCDKSVTRIRKWYDEDHPDVQFVPDKKYGGYKSITVRDCKGKTADLAAFVLQAYNKSFEQGRAKTARPLNF